MKNLLVILSIVLIGCDLRPETEKNKSVLEARYQTVIIEECEYIIYYNVGRAGFMAHKGNCKNHLQ